MIREFTDKWSLIKDDIANELRTSRQISYSTYEQLLLITLQHLNTVLDTNDKFNDKDIETIDFGDYQGTKILVFHKDRYQPTLTDTYYTSIEYGSCSGCDTLLNINNNGCDWNEPTEKQVQDYLTLCLHMLQRMKGFE